MSRAVERKVNPAAAGESHHLLPRGLALLRQHAVRGPKRARSLELLLVHIHGVDPRRPRLLGGLHNREPHGPQPPHRHARPRRHLRGVPHGPQPRRHAARQHADLVQVGSLAHLRKVRRHHHGVFTERRRHREHVHHLAGRRAEARGAVHQETGGARCLAAVVRLTGHAHVARRLQALPQETRENVVPGSKALDAGAHRLNDAGRLVPRHEGERHPEQAAHADEVRVAHGAADHLQAHLPSLRWVDDDVRDRQRLADGGADGGAARDGFACGGLRHCWRRCCVERGGGSLVVSMKYRYCSF
eukprot:Rhum_TRINITY_DN2943_c0_g4::Rhum_TRINITY_DN2943_c0_g4_i1::g.8889::m.8889